MKILLKLLIQRLKIRKIYKNGIGQPFVLLRYIFPIICILLFLLLLDNLNLTKTNFLDLIKQINNLVGIILGFSIASFAIFISISNDKLETKSQQTEYTYREIGSSLFFYNVEVALFTSLIGILLQYINLPSINIVDIFLMFINIKILLFMIYILMFFQLIFNLFYSSVFLNSSIKK